MSEVTVWLRKNDACDEARKWAKQYKTLSEAWANCSNPEWMLWVLDKKIAATDVRYRLFACWAVRNTPLADGRKVWDLLTDERSRNAVVVAEKFCKGEATQEELDAAGDAAGDAAWDAAWAAAGAAAWAAAWDAQCNGIRLIFGNPFDSQESVETTQEVNTEKVTVNPAGLLLGL